MSHSKFGLFLSAKKFTLDDQFLFARLSGDFNPIHVDIIYSRRTLYGHCIVHGVNASMWAINALIKKIGIYPSSYKCKFKKPIFLDESVSCYWNDTNKKLTIATGDIEVTTISIVSSLITVDNINYDDLKFQHRFDKSTDPINLSPSDYLSVEKIQNWIPSGEIELAKSLFPFFCKYLGLYTVLEISTLSKIVGMQYPGLHSLFASFNIQLFMPSDVRSFMITNFDARFNKVDLHAKGKLISASIEAFFRPQPTKSESLFNLSKLVHKNEFHKVRALIIGGSRGIGEVVAKLICAGGGSVTLTYHVGLSDAKNLSSEIQAAGGNCNYIQYSIQTHPEDINLPTSFNQIYYFASPKILAESSKINNEDLVSNYINYYVEGFDKICNYFSKHSPSIYIYYPSTVYIDEPTNEFTAYINAKLLGEGICKEYNFKKIIHVISNRLPRLPSDQNQGIIPEDLADIPDTIIPIIRCMTLKKSK